MTQINPTYLALGQKIINYRNDANIKQEEFAKMLGISRTTLSFIENGTQAPNFDVLINLIRITHIDFLDIIGCKQENYIVLDTNILLNRPEMLNIVLKDCDKVYIPVPVIKEINYQKDHGKDKYRRNASLCEDILLKKKSEKLDIHTDSKLDGTNDDKIFDVAFKLAKKNASSNVYLLTNDKDFKLKDTKNLDNLKVISSVQYGSIFSEKDGFNETLSQRFFMAVFKKNLEEAKSLIKDKENVINVNVVDARSGRTPLIAALLNKDEQMVKFLLSLDRIDVNAVDEKKYLFPPLSHVMQMHNERDAMKFARMLIDKGANVNEPSQNETNAFNMPLMIACWHGHFECVKLLVENGAFINQQDQKNGFTALIKAIFKNSDKEIVKYLLDKGADIDILTYQDKKTALDYAYDTGDRALIDLLKEKKEERDNRKND
ncbi:ankyrin repeat domain-containing protein [Lachnospira multipara]|uniref:ankyrin repeat domain-containing protein n=1 Tax=Lachnospira multipara TaxID=28051 RepID=UPI0003FAE4BF|nr:ankyrin repeat domain-containing protein [Lachnospira multipara]